VVGYVYDGLGNIHGFVEDGGVFTEIDVPPGADAFGTDPYGTEVLESTTAANWSAFTTTTLAPTASSRL